MPMMYSLHSVHRPHNLGHTTSPTHSPTPTRLHLRSGDSQHPTQLSPIQRVGFLPTADFESNGTQRVSFIARSRVLLPMASSSSESTLSPCERLPDDLLLRVLGYGMLGPRGPESWSGALRGVNR